MRIDFNPYVIVYTDDTDIYDVHLIIIDTEEKTIDCCDTYGMSIAGIHYENAKEIGYLKYNEKERLTGDSEILVKNGKLIIQGCWYHVWRKKQIQNINGQIRLKEFDLALIKDIDKFHKL